MNRLPLVLSLVLCAALSALAQTPAPATPPLVDKQAKDKSLTVHEWGVFIRQNGPSGTLFGAPDALISGLPSFVTRATPQQPDMGGPSWDKPVLYFYGPEGLALTVKIAAPLGRMTAYYPLAQPVYTSVGTDVPPGAAPPVRPGVRLNRMMIARPTELSGVEWRGTLSSDPQGKVADVAKDHWWSAAREVGASYFTPSQPFARANPNFVSTSERFLFYEATAAQEPPLQITLDAATMTIKNTAAVGSGRVLVVLNTGEKDIHYLHKLRIDAGASVQLAKADLFKEMADPKPSGRSTEENISPTEESISLLQATAAQWRSGGMTAEESNAIAKIWLDDVAQPYRLMVIYRMPEATYDKMFPLTITPKPDKLVRVGMVFDCLPDQSARADWMPGLPAQLEKLAAALGDDDFKKRDEATKNLAALGDLAKPTLEKLAKSSDAEVRTRAVKLLADLKAKETPKPAGQPQGDPTVLPVRVLRVGPGVRPLRAETPEINRAAPAPATQPAAK